MQGSLVALPRRASAREEEWTGRAGSEWRAGEVSQPLRSATALPTRYG